MKHNNFRSIKAGTLDAILPPKAAPERVGLISAGNPNVLREAAGLESYARKRKRGGRVKIDGVRPKHRLDRPSRRKFADGGTADDRPATSDDASSSNRGFVDALMANPKVRAIAAGLAGIQKATPVVMRAIQEDPTQLLGGSKPAYRRGGSADALVGSDVLRANSKVRKVGAAAIDKGGRELRRGGSAR
jgi:hypothetical protein